MVLGSPAQGDDLDDEDGDDDLNDEDGDDDDGDMKSQDKMTPECVLQNLRTKI